jgi:hypothetical protein
MKPFRNQQPALRWAMAAGSLRCGIEAVKAPGRLQKDN